MNLCLNSNDLVQLSVIMDNPTAFPDVPVLSAACRQIVLSQPFDVLIAVVILINGIVMATHHYPMDSEFAQVQTKLDYVFIVIYVLEVMMKMLGLGIMPYFAVPFHKMDFCVVLMSIVSIFIPKAKGATATRMVRLVLRVIRMLRLLKLVAKVDTVVYLIKALTSSGGKLINMTGLIIFFIVLLATVTMHWVGNCNGKGEDLARAYRSNFYTFYDSLLSNFQIFTGEDWAPIMFSHMDACPQSKVSIAIFFAFTFCIYNFVLMNVFTAIILHNFTVPEDEKMAKQKALYRESQGTDSEKADLAVLAWLAEAAQDDKEALTALEKSLEAVLDVGEVLGGRFARVCAVLHHKPPLEAATNEMLQLSAMHVKKKVEYEEKKLEIKKSPLRAEVKGLSEKAKDQQLSPEVRNEHKTMRDTKYADLQIMQADVRMLEQQGIEIWRKFKEKEASVEELKNFSSMGKHRDFALCCLPRNFVLRRLFNYIQGSHQFEIVMVVVIVLSSICLAWTPNTQPGWVVVMGHICTGIFVAEAAIKIIALNARVFFSDTWNVIDFIIVAAAVSELFLPETGAAGTLKVFRLLRLLRALRFIKHVDSLQLLVHVLIGCLPSVMATLAIVMIIYVCFGILGLFLFGGLFHRCECVDNLNCPDDGDFTPNAVCDRLVNNTVAACEGVDSAGHDRYLTLECLHGTQDAVLALSNSTVQWANPAYNFDDIGSAGTLLGQHQTYLDLTTRTRSSLLSNI